MSTLIDMTGQKIKSVTVIEYLGGKAKKWLCVCYCGRERAIRGRSLRLGKIAVKCSCKEKNK